MPDTDQTTTTDAARRPRRGHWITITKRGVFRVHGHPAKRCRASGKSPATAAQPSR